MGGFKSFGKKNFGGGNRSFGDRGDRGGFGPKPFLHQAVCAACGKQCQVPFKPSGDRAVYCRECFGGQEKGAQKMDSRPFTKAKFSDDKPKFKAECSKCGQNCEVPFRPLEGKKVFCAECFDKGINAGVKTAGQFNDQFIALNAKLDKILHLLAVQEVASTPLIEMAAEPMPEEKKTKTTKPAAKKPVAKKKK